MSAVTAPGCSDLERAILNSANLAKTHLVGANPEGADLKHPVLTGVVWVGGDQNTCPDGTIIDGAKMTCEGNL